MAQQMAAQQMPMGGMGGPGQDPDKQFKAEDLVLDKWFAMQAAAPTCDVSRTSITSVTTSARS